MEFNKDDEAYALFKGDYAIYRNACLNWFFNNITKNVKIVQSQRHKGDESDTSLIDDIQVLSWLPASNSDLRQEMRHTENQPAMPTSKCSLQPETKVCFVSSKYRLVFALDLSPSLFHVSTKSMNTFAEDLLLRLSECLCSLVEPIQVPHSDYSLKPDIYVTVFTQTLQVETPDGRYRQDVIVQGCLLTPSSVITILKKLECKIFHEKQLWRNTGQKTNAFPTKHDHGLVSMLRTGLLALQLLPLTGYPAMILLTDGAVGMPDMANLESLLIQLRIMQVSCSIIQIRRCKASLGSYSYCPSMELLEFISSATCGTFFYDDYQANARPADLVWKYQRGIFTWQIQLNTLTEMHDIRSWGSEANLKYSPEMRNVFIAPTLRKKQLEKNLRLSMFAVLSIRLREGYVINSISFIEAQSQLQIELVYSWNHSTSIKYMITSAWPPAKNQSKVEVFVEGTYELLFDIISKVQDQNLSRYRFALQRKFSNFMKSVNQSDLTMMHFLSFSSAPEHYRLMQKHVPLFYLPPNSNQLVLALQDENDSFKSSLSLYWKPILTLDTSTWQKWLDTHRIDVVLNHDVPLPKCLHVPSDSGRFHSIQSSCAMTEVASLLREWCTFVLLDNHTYVKFIYKNDEIPSSFYIARLINKAPIVTIRLAFLIGTAGSYRNQVLRDLSDRILSLTFPSASKSSKVNFRSRTTSSMNTPAHLSDPERFCVTLFHKPLDHICIRYDRPPKEFLHPPVCLNRRSKSLHGLSFSDIESSVGFLGGEIATAMMLDPSRYLKFRRSVWPLTKRSMTPLSLKVTGEMAGLLVKLRLSEGFTFASASSGVISMIREFSMHCSVDTESSDDTRHCIAQFILFPPTTSSTSKNDDKWHGYSSDGSVDEQESEHFKEVDGNAFIVTEIWIEPQYGVVVPDVDPRSPNVKGNRNKSDASSLSFAHQRFVGLTYDEVSDALQQEDGDLLSTLVTIEHLHMMCVPNTSMRNMLPKRRQTLRRHPIMKTTRKTCDAYPETALSEGNISSTKEDITLSSELFDFIALLARCPQTNLLLMALSSEHGISANEYEQNDSLLQLFHVRLEDICDREAKLSEEDSHDITRHIVERENSFEVDWSTKRFACRWRCYLKVLRKAKVLIILVPFSFSDLKNLMSYVSIDDDQSKPKEQDEVVVEGLKSPVYARVPSFDDKLTRRRSLRRIVSVNKSTSEKVFDHERLTSDTMPVYVYECITSDLVDLFLEEHIRVPRKIFESDIVFDYRMQSVDHEAAINSLKTGFRRSYSQSASTPQTFVRNNSESMDGVLLSNPGSHEAAHGTDTANFCETIVDVYHRCFVCSVYSCLQQNEGKGAARKDVQAIIDTLCVETVQEIDITQFLLITCPQVAAFRTQHLLQEVQDQANDVFPLGPVSERTFLRSTNVRSVKRHSSSTSSNSDSVQLTDNYNEDFAGNNPQMITLKHGGRSAFKKLLRKPHSLSESDELKSDDIAGSNVKDGISEKTLLEKPLRKKILGSKINWMDLPQFPVSLFEESHARHTSGNDDQVQSNFLSVLSQNFSCIPVMSDVYYYKQHGLFEDAETGMVEGNVLKCEQTLKHETNDHRQFSELCHSNIIEEISSMSSDDTSESEDIAHESNAPLFLCMTCTVRDKKTGNHGTMLVEGLPDNLQRVISHLEYQYEFIDLSQLSVTLDLIWLSLPVMQNKVGIVPKSEYSSGLLNEENGSLSEFDFDSQKKYAFNDDDDGKEEKDALFDLPHAHRDAVHTTKLQIEWLLRDEIISALRTGESIDVSTLEQVVAHIEDSLGENRMVKSVDLQFVFGAEKSFPIFKTLFEKRLKHFNGYKMNCAGKFYYLTTDRTFLPIQHWPGQEIEDVEKRAGNVQVGPRSHDISGKEKSKENLRNPESVSLERQDSTLDSHQFRDLKRCTNVVSSLPHQTRFLHSSPSVHSLPDSDTMSVNAIEYDAGVLRDNVLSKQRELMWSSQSTPTRTTSPIVGAISCQNISPECRDNVGHKSQEKTVKCRISRARLSLPDTTAPKSTFGKNGNVKYYSVRAVKYCGVESCSDVSDGRSQPEGISTNSAAPLSVGHSPSPVVSPALPHMRKRHHTTIGSVRRSSASVTPVDQAAFLQARSELPLCAPMFKESNTDGNILMPATKSATSLSFHGLDRDMAASPMSFSDGEVPRLSTTSLLESGYDAEISDFDGEDNDAASIYQDNDLPSFWLIVHLVSDSVKIYFHRRMSNNIPPIIVEEQNCLVDTMSNYIEATCRCANQTLLLTELHDSRLCNPLLVEETEEDIWQHDYSHSYPGFGHMDDHSDGVGQDLLAASMTIAPDQFACNCILEKVIPLHPRLGVTGNIPGKSGVMPAVRDLVVNLLVSNRQNMFVFSLTDKSVFYCCLEEDLSSCSNKSEGKILSQPIHSHSGLDSFKSDATGISNLTLSHVEPTTGKLILRWHGVGPVSPLQVDELEKMNDSIIRRLNDSVLEKITVLLQRNSKLYPTDIEFIQPTVSGVEENNLVRSVTPTCTLSYGIGMEFLSCLSALRYYLHQNLLCFMGVPRYVDATQPSGCFVPYKLQNDVPAKSGSLLQKDSDSSVYLFHQSLEPGKTGYGIACVVVEIACNKNHAVVQQYSELKLPKNMSVQELVGLTNVNDNFLANLHAIRSPVEKMASPSNPIFIHFHLWIRGTLTLKHLSLHLKPAVSHALFDTVSELHVLQLPLTSMESHGDSRSDVTLLSELSKLRKNDAGSRRTDAMRSLFGSINDSSSSLSHGIFTNLLHQKAEFPMVEERKAKNGDETKLPADFIYERNLTGNSSNLSEKLKQLKAWLSSMEIANCPSVFKEELQLEATFPPENLFQELHTLLRSLLKGCKAKLFFCSAGNCNESTHEFAEVTARRKSRTPRCCSFVMVARNLALWKAATGHSLPDEYTTPNTLKFLPFNSLCKLEQSPRTQDHLFVTHSSRYVPRQQFVLICSQDQQVQVWGYNVSNEIANSLQADMRRLVHFHIARRRALNCLTYQKLALFRHYTANHSTERGNNPFMQDAKDIDIVLSNSHTPSEVEMRSQQRSRPSRRPIFKDVYLSNMPVTPLDQSSYSHVRGGDCATQYSKQYQEVKAILKKKNEEQLLLQRMFSNWREHPTSTSSSYTVLTKEILLALLYHTKIIHHVTSPILFSLNLRNWIQSFKQVEPQGKQKFQKRLSGTFRKSVDSSGKISDDAGPRVRNSLGKNDEGKSDVSTADRNVYDSEELKNAVMLQYIQYWQSMHFILVKEDKRGRTDKISRKKLLHGISSNSSFSVSGNGGASDVKYPSYLYKPSPDGIIIVEISFTRLTFSVKLHVIDTTRLLLQPPSRQQANILFLNDCEHVKDLVHLHSFLHDFHLRYILMYIQERQTGLKSGFDLVEFCHKFIKFYSTIPACAFNLMSDGIIDSHCSHVSADELFEYLVGKPHHLGFKTLKLLQPMGKEEHALVSAHVVFGKTHSVSCTVDEHEVYDTGYVVWHAADHSKFENDEKKIRFNYYLLFTNRRRLFPQLERNDYRSQGVPHGRRGSENVAPKNESITTYTNLNVKQKSSSPTAQSPLSLLSPESNVLPTQKLMYRGRRQSMPNVGSVMKVKQPPPATEVPQTRLSVTLEKHGDPEKGSPSFVKCEKTRLADYIVNICASAEIQCYRNQLWDKVCLQKSSQSSCLSIEDFEHMLKHCQMTPLSEFDDRGNLLCDPAMVDIQWGFALQKQILGRFDQMCRYFATADGSKRYLGVLNPKLYLMMFLITVDVPDDKLGMFVVTRDKLPDIGKSELDLNIDSKIVALRAHTNNMIEFISYYTWSALCS